MRKTITFVAMFALSMACSTPAWSQATCGGAATYVSGEWNALGGTGVDTPGAEQGGTILSPVNGSIAIEGPNGSFFDYILGADFWNAIDSSNCNTNTNILNANCNDDPEAVADGSQFTMTSMAGNSSENTNLTAPDSIYIATASSPSSLHSGWTNKIITGACDKFPSYPNEDFPHLAYNPNWLVVEVNCLNSNRVFGGQEIRVIDKSSFYSSGAINDTTLTSSAPLNYLEEPLTSLNADSTIYLATPETTDGSATVYFAKISGVSSPSYTWNVAHTTISVSGSKSGIRKLGGIARVPNLNQSGCTYCLGHAEDTVFPRGDESAWANFDSVLEVTFPQKYGGSTDGETLDGSALVEVVTWDLTASKSPFSWWSSDSTQGGGIDHSWPSIAHAVVNSTDHIILADTLARHQSGSTHHPTNEILRISP